MSDDDTTMSAPESDTSQEQTSAPEQSEAAATTAPQTEVEASGDQTANAAPDTKPADSLTPPHNETTEQTPPAKDWTKEGPVLEKRLRDQQSHYDRQIAQWRQQYSQSEQQKQELAKFKQEQEARAQAAALKPWSKLHPENAKFSGVLERAKAVSAQLARIPKNLPPEQQQAMQDAIMSALTPEEQTQISEYRESINNFQRDWVADPHGTLVPMVQPMVQQMIQQEFQRLQATSDVQRDFQDPELQPLLKQYGEDFKLALEQGVPYDHAKHELKMYSRIKELESQIQKLSGKAAHADEQVRLAKGEAAHTRDPRTPQKDPYQLAVAEAEKKGIVPGSPAFVKLLQKHSN